MRRAGGWILGVVAVAAMAVGGTLAFRPILQREALSISLVSETPGPTHDALVSGMEFALAEAGRRAGPFRIELVDASVDRKANTSMKILLEDPKLLVASTWIEDKFGRLQKSVDLCLLAEDEQLGQSAARWANESGAGRVVLLRQPEARQTADCSRGFQEAAAKIVLTADIEVDWRERHSPALDQVIAANPDFVFYAGDLPPYGRAFELFSELRKKGYAGRLMMADADPKISYLAVPEPTVEGTLLASIIGPPSREFAAAYEPATQRHAGPHAWPGYLLMKRVLDLIDHVDSRNPGDLCRALQAMPDTRRPCALYESKGGKWVFVQDLK